jgi:hypothetical protein
MTEDQSDERTGRIDEIQSGYLGQFIKALPPAA